MDDPTNHTDKRRPLAVTVLCLVGAVTVSIAAIAGLIRDVQHASSLIPVHLAGSGAVLAAFMGIWRMRWWGILLYALAIAGNLTILAGAGTVRWPHIAVPIAIASIVLCYYRRLQWAAGGTQGMEDPEEKNDT